MNEPLHQPPFSIPEKLHALRQFMDKKDLTVENELTATIQKICEKYVPLQVWEFIENAEESGQNRSSKTLQDKGVVSNPRHNAKETSNWQSQSVKT